MTEVYNNCALAVDVVLLTVRDESLQVLLINRQHPRRGQEALPGGFVLPNEDLRPAAERELKEETHIDATDIHLEQLQTYGAPKRDPRGRVVTVAHLGLWPNLPVPKAGTDAVGASWRPVADVLNGRRRLAFDHKTILRDAVERARAKLEYTTLATAFCPTEFTMSELRRIYEIVWSRAVDPRNFQRKWIASESLMLTGSTTTRDGGRPAALYRLHPDSTGILHPPMPRQPPG